MTDLTTYAPIFCPISRPAMVERRATPPSLARAVQPTWRWSGGNSACAIHWTTACARPGIASSATARLVKAETGKLIWAQRYDRKLPLIFARQDAITEAVTTAVVPAIDNAERRSAMLRSPESLDAWGAYQRGLWHMAKFSSEHNAHARGFFGQAIELGPRFSGGYRVLSMARAQSASLSHTRDLGEVLRSAEAAARQAVSLDGSDAESRAYLSFALCQRGDYESALAEAKRALALSSNLARGHATLGGALVLSRRPKEGVIALETAIRLDAYEPMLPNRLNLLAVGLYFAGQYEATVEAARRTIHSSADYPLVYRWLAAALGQLGRIAEAERALAKAIGVAPDLFDKHVCQRVPWLRSEDYAHMPEGLRKAGWRD